MALQFNNATGMWFDDEVVNAFQGGITDGIDMTPYTGEVVSMTPDATTSASDVASAPYEVLKVDGTTHNLVTDETGVDKTLPSVKNNANNELNAALQSGDEYALTKAHRRNMELMGQSGFDYGLKTEADGWATTLTALATSALVLAIAKKQGADNAQLAPMAGEALKVSGRIMKSHQDRLSRQGNIDYLEAQGYLPEDIRAWLETGNQEDLISTLKNRPYAETLTDKLQHFSKGDTLPDGTKAKKSGSYQTFYTHTMSGLPQVASVEYVGDLAQKNLQQDLAIKQRKNEIDAAKVQLGYDQMAFQRQQKQAEQQVTEQEKQKDLTSGLANTFQFMSLVDTMSKHEGLNPAHGWTSMFPTTAGSDAANYESMFGSLKGQSFLEMRDSFGTMGSITDAQMEMISNALESMDLSQSPAEVRRSLTNIANHLTQTINNVWTELDDTSKQQMINYANGIGVQLQVSPDGNSVQVVGTSRPTQAVGQSAVSNIGQFQGAPQGARPVQFNGQTFYELNGVFYNSAGQPVDDSGLPL